MILEKTSGVSLNYSGTSPFSMGQAPSDEGHASSAYGVLMAVSNGANLPSPTSGGGFHPFFDGFRNPVIADAGAPLIGGQSDFLSPMEKGDELLFIFQAG